MKLVFIVFGFVCTFYGVTGDCSGSKLLTETYTNTKAVPIRTEIEWIDGGKRSICQQALKMHNQERNRHQGTGSLTYNDTLAKQSEAWAMHLAALAGKNKLTTVKHSTRNGGEGENVYHEIIIYDYDNFHKQPVTLAGSYWMYEEFESRYNYTTAIGSRKASNFTQMVWVDTKQVGCGSAKIPVNAGTHYVVVCQYLPAGNKVIRRTGKTAEEDRWFAYTSNVKPLKPGYAYTEERKLERLENSSLDYKRELIDLVQLLLRSKK